MAQTGMPARSVHPLLRELRRVARGALRRPARTAETLALLGRAVSRTESLSVEERAGAVVVRMRSRHEAGPCTLTCVVQDAQASSPLTPCEQTVAELLCEGLTLAQIARLRGVSINTIKSQVRQVFRKLDVESRVALVRKLGL
jgi:DNA-binding NarL/FixJ family response regulator